MNNENRKKLIIIGSIICAVLVLGLITTYAFFRVPGMNNKNEELSLTSGTMELVFSDGDNGINEELSFGQTVTKKFILENTGSLAASVKLSWLDLVNTYTYGSLVYKLSYSKELDGEYKELVPESNVPVSHESLKQSLSNELSVAAGESYYFNLDITLKYLDDVDQTTDFGAIFQTQFTVGEAEKYIYYYLNVDPNGGTWNEFTSIQKYQMQKDETMEISDPTRIGYTFNGWDLVGEGSKIEPSIFTMGIENSNLTAKWTPNKYQVLIDLGDGNSNTQEVEFGSNITLPENPSREGYTFGGWDITGGILNENVLTLTDPNNVNITAKWTINKYKYIVYHNKMNIDGNGYTFVDADTDEGEADYNSSVTPGVKNYNGFYIPAVKNLTIKEENVYPPVLNKIEYNYDRKKYNLTLDLQGGSSNIVGGEMFYEARLDLGVPTKEGYDFTNWTVNGEVVRDNIFTMSSENVIAIANYNPKVFSVTFNANGGTVDTGSKTVIYDSNYGDLPVPTYDGFEFLGWFTASSGGTKVTSSTVVSLNENQTLFAQWKKSLIEIAFGLKANPSNITDYESGDKGEMYTFNHLATDQTESLVDYRYIGSIPNNYINFNNELWRIVGIFTVEDSNNQTYKTIKLIRENFFIHNWHSTLQNEWTVSDLYNLLNFGDYYNKSGDFSSDGLSAESKSKILKTKFYLGGVIGYENLGAEDYYISERGLATCTTEGVSMCSSVVRKNNILQDVGLLYPSDYAYTFANNIESICYTNGFQCNNGTPSKSWLFTSLYEDLSLITPRADSYNHVFYVKGSITSAGAASNRVIKPVVHLKPTVKITGGSGTSTDPYTVS